MDRRVTGDPDRLEALTRDLLPRLEPVRERVQACARALAAFEEARTDALGAGIVDQTPLISGELDLLEEVDRAPAAFAFGLRHLDANPHPVRVSDARWFDTLVATCLDDPDADRDDAADALDASWQLPWEDGVGDWLRGAVGSASLWTGVGIDQALAAVSRLEERLVQHVRPHTRNGAPVRGYVRRRPGWSERMNRLTSAARVADAGAAARVGRRVAPFLVESAFQVHEDWGDQSLSTGDRIARTSSTAALSGAGATGGAALGAAVGSLLGPPGMAAGGVLGGFVGAEVGLNVRDNLQGGIDEMGDRIDGALQTGADLAGDALDTMGDVTDTAAEVTGEAIEETQEALGRLTP